jgi:hypothetical protein
LSMSSMLFRRNWLPGPPPKAKNNDEHSKSFGFTHKRNFYKTPGIGYPLPYSSPHDFGMRPNSDTIPSLHEDRSDPHALWA